MDISVADPDPGFDAFLTPGSGIRNRFFPDLGSQIPNPYFWELSDNFLCKKFYNSLTIGLNFFFQHFKNKIVQFGKIYGSKKKAWQQIFFHPCLSLLFLDPGSGIRDPGWVKSGSGINIPDPQHWWIWFSSHFLLGLRHSHVTTHPLWPWWAPSDHGQSRSPACCTPPPPATSGRG